MNSCTFMGYLTRDFDIRKKDGKTVARGSMALDRGKDKDGNDRGADFPSLVAFDKKAEFLEKFGKKGRRFLVECHVKTGSYENEQGAKVYTTDFIIDRIEFADSKPSDSNPAPASDTGFMNFPDSFDEKLPFD